MKEKKFNPKNLDKLNNPKRLEALPPEFIIDKAKIIDPEVIIDLGAGTGFFSIPFSELFKKSKIYACDISDVMVDWMKNNIVSKHKNIIPTQMEDNKISLDSNIADFILMINLHHELDKPEKTLIECHRLLKTKGTVVIADWKNEKTEGGPPLELRYDTDKVKKQLLEAGFQKVTIHSQLKNNFVIVAKKNLQSQNIIIK